MNPETTVLDLLKQHRATLVRDGHHQVWELPDGSRFVRAKTPSDHRAAQNQLSELRRLLGLNNTAPVEGERRKAKSKGRSEQPLLQPTFNPLAESLSPAYNPATASQRKRTISTIKDTETQMSTTSRMFSSWSVMTAISPHATPQSPASASLADRLRWLHP